MTKHNRDLDRIICALQAGAKIYKSRSMDSIRVDRKSGGDPVTDAEREVNQLLFEMLVQPGEGWLSEESADNPDRLVRRRVWLVDPLDGTKEYVSGIPEWCISIALMEERRLVAAGILNPCTDEMFYGSVETGIASNVCADDLKIENSDLGDALVLGSRSEVKRGEWERFRRAKFRLQPMGSVAYKLALVAVGKADATWTLVPKHEWDVAAGVALVLFSGGLVVGLDGQPLEFNRANPLYSGLIGFSSAGVQRLRPFLAEVLDTPTFEDCRPWARVVAESVAKA